MVHLPFYRIRKTKYYQRFMRTQLGLSCLVVCIAAWIIQSELIQYLQTEKKFNKPYFIIWWCNCLYTLAIPLQLIRRFMHGPPGGYMNTYLHAETLFNEASSSSSSSSSSSHFKHKQQSLIANTIHDILTKFLIPLQAKFERFFYVLFEQTPPSTYSIGILAVLTTVPNWLWYLALPKTTVSDITAISNCSVIFAYVFAIILLKEPVEMRKVVGLMLSFGGVICIASATALQAETLASSSHSNSGSSQSSTSNPVELPTRGVIVGNTGNGAEEDTIYSNWNTRLMGDLMGLFGSALYGLYDIVYVRCAAQAQHNYIRHHGHHLLRGRHQHESQTDLGSTSPHPNDTSTSPTIPHFTNGSSRSSSITGGTVTTPSSNLFSPSATQAIAQHIQSTLSMSVTALTGLFCLCFLWIPIPILHFARVEIFKFPDLEVMQYLVVIGFLSCIYNACYILGMSCTSQLTFLCGLMMALPVTMILDYVVKKNEMQFWGVVGIVLILGAQLVIASGKEIQTNRFLEQFKQNLAKLAKNPHHHHQQHQYQGHYSRVGASSKEDVALSSLR